MRYQYMCLAALAKGCQPATWGTGMIQWVLCNLGIYGIVLMTKIRGPYWT